MLIYKVLFRTETISMLKLRILRKLPNLYIYSCTQYAVDASAYIYYEM